MRRLRPLLVSLGLALAVTSGVAEAAKSAKPFTLKRRYSDKATALPQTALVNTTEGTQHLDEQHYTNVRDATLAMLAKYPPANHYYVSLGRSPVSIHAFLQALDPNLSVTFPASDLRITNPAQHQGEYNKHFEHYIPAEVLKGERGDIVIFDRSHNNSGSSLARLKPVLEAYLASKGYPTKVVALGLAGAGPLQQGVEFLSTQPFPGVFRYFSGNDHDENVATYTGKHTIGSHTVEQLTPNPQYAGFLAQMKERMKRDKTLDDHLTKDEHLKIHTAE